MNKHKIRLLEPLMMLFVSILIVANITSQKFFELNLFDLHLSMDVGTLLLFPLLYIISDLLVEVYGFATARKVMWYGFGAQLLAVLLFEAAIAMPASELFTQHSAFKSTLRAVPALVVASLSGYLAGSYSNNLVMAKMKAWMIKWDHTHKWIALRTIGSTLIGEALDTILFVGLATLFGIFPLELLASLILTQWLLKSAIEALLTPLTVTLIKVVKRYEELDIVETGSYTLLSLRDGEGENIYHKKQ